MPRSHSVFSLIRGLFVVLAVILSFNGLTGQPTLALAAGSTYTVNSTTDCLTRIKVMAFVSHL